VVPEPLEDLLEGLADLDALLMIDQGDRGDSVDERILGFGGPPGKALPELHKIILSIAHSHQRAPR